MSTFPTMYSDDITLDIISLALSSSLSLCRLVLCKVSLFTRIYKQPSDSIPGEERNPRYDRRRQHTVTPSLSLSKRIDLVEHRNERTHILFFLFLRLTHVIGLWAVYISNQSLIWNNSNSYCESFQSSDGRYATSTSLSSKVGDWQCSHQKLRPLTKYPEISEIVEELLKFYVAALTLVTMDTSAMLSFPAWST